MSEKSACWEKEFTIKVTAIWRLYHCMFSAWSWQICFCIKHGYCVFFFLLLLLFGLVEIVHFKSKSVSWCVNIKINIMFFLHILCLVPWRWHRKITNCKLLWCDHCEFSNVLTVGWAIIRLISMPSLSVGYNIICYYFSTKNPYSFSLQLNVQKSESTHSHTIPSFHHAVPYKQGRQQFFIFSIVILKFLTDL